MSELLNAPWMLEGGIFLAVMLVAVILMLALGNNSNKRLQRRIAHIRDRKRSALSKNIERAQLRRKTNDESMPWLSKLFSKLPNMDAIRARLERAGSTMSAEKFVLICFSITAFCIVFFAFLLKKPILMGLFVGIILGFGVPHKVIGFKANSRLKQFLRLFPDAIDLIVRGLRSGLPVTESINMVSRELEDPIRSIFHNLGESVRLGVPLEKALLDMAKRLKNTEFNFFATSIILQRETGGNLSEVLSNLGEVLRTRYMMRMKIKALSPISQALRVLSAEFRTQRMLRAEQKAARLPAIMTVPMIVFILPTLFVVIIAPAVIKLLGTI